MIQKLPTSNMRVAENKDSRELERHDEKLILDIRDTPDDAQQN